MALTKVKNVLDITADTVADLASTQHKTGSVQLLGFHAKGDGGGGVFFWDASKDKSEHNGGTIIDPSIAGLVANWEYTQNLYFTPAVIGQGCWVREYSGAVNVKWFGAKGDGISDDTAAIQKAVEHKTVLIPKSSSYYLLNNVLLSGKEEIVGNGASGTSSYSQRTSLRASAGNAVFTTTSEIQGLTIKDLQCVGGKHFFLQQDRESYTAYALFENIEIWANTEEAYLGNFIFTVWRGGRSGYYGTSNTNHSFIKSLPSDEHIAGSITQTKTTNLNKVEDVYIFNSGSSSEAAIYIEYGYHWDIRNCDFESGNGGNAIEARGCYNLVVQNNWFEGNVVNDLIVATTSRGLNSHGTQLTFENNTVNGSGLTRAVFYIANASYLYCNKNFFFQIPTGVVLDHASTIGYAGVSQLNNNTVTASSESFTNSLLTSVDQTKDYKRINVLPIGKNGVDRTDFTFSNYQSATVTSAFNSNDVMQITITTLADYAYYEVPAKLVKLLQGKTVTFAALGYGNGISANATMSIRVWKDGDTPAYNSGTSGVFVSNPANTDIAIGKVTVTVGASDTTLKVGFSSGGATSFNSKVTIESLALFVGEIRDLEALELI
jgi:hypothetical protein